MDNSDTSKGYYTYSVVELDGSSNEIAANGEVTYTVNGSSSTYTESESSTEERTDLNDTNRVTAKNITITNTLKNKYYGFELTKVDKNNSSTKLNGVEFSLYSDSNLNNIVNFTQNQSDATVYTYAATAQQGTTTTTLTTGGTDGSSNAKGIISVSGLPEGTYYLKETKAAPGFNLLDGTVTIVLGSSTTNGSATTTAKNGSISNGSYNSTTYTLSFTLSNTPGTALPSAGGRGITIFLELGASLIAVAAGLLVLKKKRLF